jgi:hypothetical protein
VAKFEGSTRLTSTGSLGFPGTGNLSRKGLRFRWGNLSHLFPCRFIGGKILNGKLQANCRMANGPDHAEHPKLLPPPHFDSGRSCVHLVRASVPRPLSCCEKAVMERAAARKGQARWPPVLVQLSVAARF